MWAGEHLQLLQHDRVNNKTVGNGKLPHWGFYLKLEKVKPLGDHMRFWRRQRFSVLGPLLQERHWGAGERTEKDNGVWSTSLTKNSWGCWRCLVWRKEGTLSLYSHLKGAWSQVGISLFSQVTTDRKKGTKGGLDWIVGKFLHGKGCQALGQALSDFGTGCPRKPPFLEGFKRYIDVTLQDMV